MLWYTIRHEGNAYHHRFQFVRTIPILLQAGYLTIKEVRGNTFTLGISNQEMRQDIHTMLLEFQAGGSRITERK